MAVDKMSNLLRTAKSAPRRAGVYIFRRGITPLYVGKAANLRQRLASYFTKAEGRAPKVERMLAEATRLETIETASEIEALIKEAELIKKHRPKYNLLMRDDKSYFYVGVTREPYSRIFIGHQPGRQQEARNKKQEARYIGPFTSGSALRVTLKHLRRIFSYCTCREPHKRPCLNSEIGRCPGYCCMMPGSKKQEARSKRERGEYRKNIQRIIAVLSGDRTRLVGRLKREMKEAVRRERYEEAARLRDAVFGLEDVFAHRQVLHIPGSTELTTGEARYPWPFLLGKLQALLKTKRDITRIEGYDISNISGTGATGSMVVFTNGLPDKSQYRKFRIRMAAPPGGGSDTAMLKEVLRRRLGHPEWPYPELVVIDGGKGQLNAALRALAESRMTNAKRPLVTALAKREEVLFTAKGQMLHLRRQDPALLHIFQRIRDESHRFARAYHHKLRKKYFAGA